MNRSILAALALTASASIAGAQTGTQTVTFAVAAINQLSFTGTPSLTINAATAGSAPTSVSTSTLTYAITTNESDKKIRASLDTDMPTGVTLKANMAAPSGALSASDQALSATAVNLVTGITQLNASGLSLTYTLEATAGAGVVASTTRTVTYTIIN
jgi:hypothetical protein